MIASSSPPIVASPQRTMVFSGRRSSGDAGKIFEMRRFDGRLIAGDTDGGSGRARHRMSLVSQTLDDAQDSLDLAISGVGFHYD